MTEFKFNIPINNSDIPVTHYLPNIQQNSFATYIFNINLFLPKKNIIIYHYEIFVTKH